MKIVRQIIYLTVLISSLGSCHSDFLEVKPQKSLLIPKTLTDLEALLNNSRTIMNRSGYLWAVADGDFRVSDSYFLSLDNPSRFNYVWSDETTNWIGDWDYSYQQVFYANVVLEGLQKMTGQYDKTKADELKGRALFHRAWALHLIAEQFAEVYDREKASSTLGIPCPVSPNVDQKTRRGTLEETYVRIFNDLKEALGLLPERPAYITYASKVAAYALLARLHLKVGEYREALEASELALSITDALIDYNDVNLTQVRSFPIPVDISTNPEILYYVTGASSTITNLNTFVDSSLYDLYSQDDLRKKLFFNDVMNYKGSYSGGTLPFMGLSTGEVYLIKTECEARLDESNKAVTTLNILRTKRYSKVEFKPFAVESRSTLISLILQERRRELVGKGITWMDLRRLNKELGRERTLSRFINGQHHTLEPGNKRYTMKMPMDEIGISGIEQNP